MNIEKQYLQRIALECFEKDALSDEFASTAMEIARGYLARARPEMQQADRNAAVSEFCFRLVDKWKDINAEKNVFSYLTQMAAFALLDYERGINRTARRYTEIDALESHERDALESRQALASVERDNIDHIKSDSQACDIVVSPTSGQMAMIFETN